MNYIEVTFDITPYEEAVADALISELGTIGYDGFSYTDQGFTAYIPAKIIMHKPSPGWKYSIFSPGTIVSKPRYRKSKTRTGTKYGKKISLPS
ncbi:MAG: hypothetical protein ACLTHQ_10645 [Odoribacter splanchnicus]